MSANLYVGDAYTIVRLAYDLYRKGREAQEAPASFRELLKHLGILKEILWKLQVHLRLEESDKDPVIVQVLEDCGDALLSFNFLVQKYRQLADTDHGFWKKRISWVIDQKEIRRCHEKFRDARELLQFALLPASQRDKMTLPGASLRDHEIDTLPTQPSSSSGITQVQSTSQDTNRHTIPRKPVPGLDAVPPSVGTSHSDAGSLPDPGPPAAAELGIGNQEFSWVWYPGTLSSTDKPHSSDIGISYSANQPHATRLKENRRKLDGTAPVSSALKEASKAFDEDTDVEKWLSYATWWLLKSKAVWRSLAQQCEEDNRVQSNSNTWESTNSVAQADADLYKSSFILEQIILAKDPMGIDMDDATWKTVISLSDVIDQELRHRRGASSLPNSLEDRLLEQDLGFHESWMSPAEEPQRVPRNIDIFDSPRRWLKPRLSDAGRTDEKVLYHTFVDAQIGAKSISMSSTTAPYLLVLSCHTGRSEIFLSLCNLAFTVNLSTTMKWSHLKLFEESTRLDGGFDFEFPNQQIVIKFLSDREHAAFLSHPTNFFGVVKDRGPRPGEVQLCRELLESYRSRDEIVDAHPATHRQRMDDSYAACELSLYDFCPEDSWKTTRRLVLSSDPSTTKPWCTSHWLPLSRVQVQVQTEEVVLMWSDYQQLDERSNGEYGVWYSYLYRPNKPNCSVTLVFKDPNAARSFVDLILQPFDTPIKTQHVDLLHTFGSESPRQRGQLYRLHELEEESHKGCHALVVINNKANNLQVADVYFLYRDFDFRIENSTRHAIEFPELEVPDYHSSIRDVARRPEDEMEEPTLASVEVAHESTHLDFSCQDELFSFMDSLLGWRLKYCRNVRLVNLDHKWPFLADSHKRPVLHLFEKRIEQEHTRYLRLAIRSMRDDEPFWVTTSPPGAHLHGSKVILKNVRICKGDEIDFKDMQAVDSASRSQQQPHTERKIVILFESNQDARDFKNKVSGVIEDLHLAERTA